ncbi:hypothetical protein M758_1G333200 [Ceratodon purpureus]|nr:hypothetical protein M758_1G333200 [Ceratodon purpureus]
MASTSGNQVQMTPTSGSPLVQMTSTSGNQVQSVQGGMKGTEEYIDFLCSLHDVPNKTTPAQSSPDNLHKLKVALTTWKEERQRYKGEQESRKAEIRESKTEIYQMIGFYSVLQGVLFQGVSSMAKLESGWKIFIFSATLSVLASAATIGVVDLKLRDLKQSTMQFSDAQKMVQGFQTLLDGLESSGDKFDWTNVKPNPAYLTALTVLKEKGEHRHMIFATVVILLLLAFSVVFPLSFYEILCGF